jgi:hypothetical protein
LLTKSDLAHELHVMTMVETLNGFKDREPGEPGRVKPARYLVQIFAPASCDEVAWTAESAGPFMAFARGDVLNSSLWDPGDLPAELLNNILIVVGVEHVLWESDEAVSHLVLVYTAVAPDTRATRLARDALRRRYGPGAAAG